MEGRLSMAGKQTTTIRAVYGKTEDRYRDLIRRFPLRPLRTDGELQRRRPGRRVTLLDRLGRNLDAALRCHLAQFFIGRLGIIQESQNKRLKQRAGWRCGHISSNLAVKWRRNGGACVIRKPRSWSRC